MSKFVSISTVIGLLALGYCLYSLWSISTIFSTPKCTNKKNCLRSYLHNKPDLDLCIFFSEKAEISSYDDIKLIDAISKFDYNQPWEKKLIIPIPKDLTQINNLYFHLYIIPSKHKNIHNKCSKIDHTVEPVSLKICLTQLHVPESYYFNLLNKNVTKIHRPKGKFFSEKRDAIIHLRGQVTFNILTDGTLLPKNDIPIELYKHIKMSDSRTFLPIAIYNFLETKLDNLKVIKSTEEEITLKYQPIYFGKMRFILNMREALAVLKKTGFSSRDIDDIKGIFASTNLVLLIVTMMITTFHIMFDFLAFKNEITFWSERTSMEGLSSRLVFWRAFSQTIICLYLFDDDSSLLVFIPSIVATVIEYWKVFKFLRRRYTQVALHAEIETNRYDAECMRYLSYFLYPLCIGGAIYSLIYQPHKSWYSWCINSIVNGVYAFGFIFMLPQLFINYRLKSVEALPWRSLMYKAFNTFIDDFFAFIISMPTSHRVACFRDDIVFLIYLYQRWLYPVDNSRRADPQDDDYYRNDGVVIEELGGMVILGEDMPEVKEKTE